MKKNKIKFRILLPVAVAIYSLVIVFYIIISHLVNYENIKDTHKKLDSIADVFNSKIVSDTEFLTAKLLILQKDKELQKHWLAKDREQLFRKANQFYQKFNIIF